MRGCSWRPWPPRVESTKRELGCEQAEAEFNLLQAEFCKGMAHPKRIQIIRALKEGERSVGDLAASTGLPQPNVSQHLAILRQIGLVTARRSGTYIYYAISDHRIVEACELVRSSIGERVKKSQLILALVP